MAALGLSARTWASNGLCHSVRADAAQLFPIHRLGNARSENCGNICKFGILAAVSSVWRPVCRAYSCQQNTSAVNPAVFSRLFAQFNMFNTKSADSSRDILAISRIRRVF